MMPPVGPRVVAIGGGHGLATTLRAVSTYATRVTAVVATGDDGGSSGRLRSWLDLPAPGDLRRCLSALAPDTELAEALEHRFGPGELEGHAVGNLVLAGLVDAGHDLTSASAKVASWLGIDPTVARVLPATSEPVTLVGHIGDGSIEGQVAVEEAGDVDRIAFDPPDPAVPGDVLTEIGVADQIVLGPGSWATSVLGAAVPTVTKAVQAAEARVVLVANLDRDPAGDVARLVAHGIDADVVVAQTGTVTTRPAGVEVVEADVDRPHGLAHDADLLGAVLAALT